MSDEAVGVGSGPEGNGAGVDPTAVALALAGASREKADAFLDNQNALIGDQRHHLHEQLKQIHLDVWEKQVGVLLRVATLCVGVAVACFLGMAVWDANHDDGLVIEAFTVPPDLAARGLTGEVAASQLLGNLSVFQSLSVSARDASSFTHNWDNDIKVEIPETGVSIGEFNRFLHEWLGHQTHITGAVYRTGSGIAVMARVGGDIAPTMTGSEAELDQLLRKTAEAIYRAAQPYRYAQYVFNAGRVKEGVMIQKTLIANGSPQDRFWAYNGVATMYASQFDFANAENAEQAAIALRPDSHSYYNVGRAELMAQHDEAALTMSQAALTAKLDPDVSEATWVTIRPFVECTVAGLKGDYQQAVKSCEQAVLLPDAAGTHRQARLLQLREFAGLHDGAGLRRAGAELSSAFDPRELAARASYEAMYDALNEFALGNRQALMDRRADLESGQVRLPYSFFFNARTVQPAIAYALALSGDFFGAHAEIDKTPADCSVCLRTHGRIDALEKNWSGADYWFARAVVDAFSTPFPFTDWGQSMLERGQPDAAIEKFKLANEKGPHFADPLEGWGEALMAKNQSHLALAKFAEADKYAPNWGRLHLKWGEALVYAGKRDEAKAQFARAAQLDLTPAEKAELARHP
jgi:tetratricopeptide (TPR) repeat protein